MGVKETLKAAIEKAQEWITDAADAVRAPVLVPVPVRPAPRGDGRRGRPGRSQR